MDGVDLHPNANVGRLLQDELVVIVKAKAVQDQALYDIIDRLPRSSRETGTNK